LKTGRPLQVTGEKRFFLLTYHDRFTACTDGNELGTLYRGVANCWVPRWGFAFTDSDQAEAELDAQNATKEMSVDEENGVRRKRGETIKALSAVSF
jgi:hypothetical protein